MKLAANLPARLAAVGLLGIAGLGVNPVAMLGTTGTSPQIVTVDGRRAVAGEVLVKYRRWLSSNERGQLDQQSGADRNDAIGRDGVRRIHSKDFDTSRLLAFLRHHPDVAYAEPNYIIQTDSTPNDTSFNQLWGLFNFGQFVGTAGTPGADIEARSAWDVSTGSRSTVIGVIDTGIDYGHPDLAANVWSAPAPFSVVIGGQTITCAAGTHGFNAIAKTCDPLDDNGHGTHVSGTIGAVGNNHLGVVGLNWTTSIMASKGFNSSGTGTLADAINAIEFVIQAAAATGANVRVLSNSWSTGGFSQALLDEINKANASNMLFVASAGNFSANSDVAPSYPSSYTAPNVIGVASTDNTDSLASSSNWGPSSVHLAAPGVNVLSTWLSLSNPFYQSGNGYQYRSGTSMAAPHVSGAAMLVLSRCALDTAALKTTLLSSVDPIPSLAGRLITGGRLNLNNAIRACLPPPPDFLLSASPATQVTTVGTGASYIATVTPTGGFTGTVTFSATGLPSGVTASFSPASVTTSGSSTMTITSSPTGPPGSFPLTIVGTSGSLIRGVSVIFEADAPAVPALAVDRVISSDGNGTQTTPSFSTTAGPETLLAFVAADGLASGGQTFTVSGAGLAWSLVKRVNTQAGTSEIWKANASGVLSNVTVSATPASGGFDQSLTVVTFVGAVGTGAIAGSNGPSGAPTVSLTTTQPGSLVYAVGNDWENAVARTVDSTQTIVHQWVDSTSGDTYWVQAATESVAAAGTLVQLRDVAPVADRWNFAAVEIVAAVAPTVAVPDVVNLTQTAATAAITSAGLTVGTVTTASSATVPAGSVISQNPAGGTQSAVGGTVTFVVSTGPPLVAVPDVANLTQAAATAAITGAGFTVGTITTASSATVAAGSVISQSPTAGTQSAAGTAVALVVSTGPPLVAVPSVVNLTQAAATAAITGAGFTVGTITTASSSTVPAGSVISQSPEAGTQSATGTAVAFVVSTGPPLVAVPSVVNLTQAAATAAITGAGFTVGTITTASSATVAAGSVISQSPTAGTQSAAGTAVALVVSTGPPLVAVPSVVNLTQAAATAAITGAGFTVGTITTASSATVAAGSVISQSPTAGTQSAAGTAVALVVSTGPPLVAVPSVVNLTQAAATAAITGAGFTVGTITTASSATVAAGSVISQSPTAGTQSAAGAAVNFVVSTGPPLVAVPNVVNLTQAAATAAITGAGFTVGTITTASSATVAAGSVISQSPTAGTQSAADTAVDVVVSTGPTLVAVPGVVNLTQAAATAALTGAGFTVGTITTASSATVAAGSVISQSPTAGTQSAAGTAVDVVVSTGPPLVAVPNIVTLTQAAATAAISAAGFTVGTITAAASTTVPAGSVISQSPTAGTQSAAGTAVAFVVSTGPPLVAVPNIVTLTQAAATAAISAAGFTVGTITAAASTTVPAGSVISQSPTAGTQSATGTAVAFVVSTGPPLVAVPNIVNLTQAAATAAITGAGLTVGTITTASSATVPAGSVISQNPTWGTQVIAGSAIAFVVSTGPAPVLPKLAVDRVVFSDGSGTRITPSFSTSAAPETLLAFVSAEGPASGGQAFTVTGAGLTWSLVKRVNTQPGSSEIWQATASGVLSNVTVSAASVFIGTKQSLTVVTFSGAAGTGAIAGASSLNGAPSVSLTTTQAGSLVYAVGNDWDNGIARTLDPTQSMAHQWVDTTAGDTYWVQATTGPVAAPGTSVQMRDAAPTTDRWNFAAVEIVAASAPLVAVPNVVNLTQAAATTAITSAGLTVGTVTTASSATVPAGSVISQNPTAGTQSAPGAAVAFVVSTGPPLVAVPNVVNLTQAAATTAITSAGLTVGTVTTASSATVSAGSVISQNPTAGTQSAPGAAVAFVVSTGPPLVAVPNVVNLTQAAATTAITSAGLTVGTVTTASSATVPAGAVISQNPTAGTQSAPGAAVAFVVSTGPPLVAVPSVVNLTQVAATTAITSAGLTVGTVTTAPSATVPAGSVISQNPTAGTQSAPGAAVAFVVSTGTSLAVDGVIFSDGSGTRTTSSFNTSVPGEILIAFATSDGPSSGGQILTVSGAGLAWTLVRRANAQAGTAEIWKATAATQLSNVAVTSTQAQGGYHQSLTVVLFSGASGTGASAAGSAAGGAPSLALTTTKAGGFVYGVGNDWDNSIARTLSADQTMVHQWVDTGVGDTFWVQARAGVTGNQGSSVQLTDVAPTGDRWNFAIVEIVP